jgi:hypothetical protein
VKEFKGWRDILSWAKENGFERISKRLEINNACWNSSGEFGRSQVAICDAMRFAKSEEERMSIAEDIEESLKGDIVIGDSNA